MRTVVSRTLVRAGLLAGVMAWPAAAQPPISVPPPYVVTSPDGTIQIGASTYFGGALVGFANPQINGNVVDYTQAGALFQPALWTLPYDPGQQLLCASAQRVNGVCQGTLPFDNPTQGGYLGDGWAGNPNPSTASVSGGVLETSWRFVNYNYDFPTPSSATDPYQWQTDFWGSMSVSFSPKLPDVALIDTTITWCKDGNAHCAGKSIQLANAGLPGLFALGTDSGVSGPYARTAYRSPTTGQTAYVTGGQVVAAGAENWAAVLQKSDVGLGIAVLDYVPFNAGLGYVLSGGTIPYIVVADPDLRKFPSQGVTLTACGNAQCFTLAPGASFSCRTYAVTGSLTHIRADLLLAQKMRL